MKEPVLKAVAQPPKLFWAPFSPAMANVGLQLPMMMILVAAYDWSPMPFMISIAIAHVFVVMAGLREPHLATVLYAFGEYVRPLKTIYPVRGKRYAP